MHIAYTEPFNAMVAVPQAAALNDHASGLRERG